MRISPNFTSKEFLLDGESLFFVPVPNKLLLALEFYREQLKSRYDNIFKNYADFVFSGIEITSYARSFHYNEYVGGHPNSHHLYDKSLRSRPDAVDFTVANFSEYHHEEMLDITRDAMLGYGIFLSTGLYHFRNFIHFNLEQSKAEMRKWNNYDTNYPSNLPK